MAYATDADDRNGNPTLGFLATLVIAIFYIDLVYKLLVKKALVAAFTPAWVYDGWSLFFVALVATAVWFVALKDAKSPEDPDTWILLSFFLSLVTAVVSLIWMIVWHVLNYFSLF